MPVQAAFYAVLRGPANATVLAAPSDFSWTGSGYSATLALNSSGVYDAAIMRGSSHLQGSPLQIEVLPDKTSTQGSTYFGTGLNTLVAGIPANLSVQVHDSPLQQSGSGRLIQNLLLCIITAPCSRYSKQ